MEGLDLGLDLEQPAAAAKPKFHLGKAEYAPPFYTINVAHVEYMPEWEVIGVNGEVLQLQRGADVPNIPQAFLNVLKNAIASRQVTTKNTDGTERYEWRPFPAIQYQITEGPYQERKVPNAGGVA